MTLNTYSINLSSFFGKTLIGLCIILILSPCLLAAGAPADLKGQIKAAINQSIRHMRHQQVENIWENDPGITSLSLYSIIQSYRNYNPKDGPFIRSPYMYLKNVQQDDGRIPTIKKSPLDNFDATAISILNFKKFKREYRSEIKKARKYLESKLRKYLSPKEKKSFLNVSQLHWTTHALLSSGTRQEDRIAKKITAYLLRCKTQEGLFKPTPLHQDKDSDLLTNLSAIKILSLIDNKTMEKECSKALPFIIKSLKNSSPHKTIQIYQSYLILSQVPVQGQSLKDSVLKDLFASKEPLVKNILSHQDKGFWGNTYNNKLFNTAYCLSALHNFYNL